jgi:hypothetical protein
MGMRMPETCWAVFKWQVINLRICCILLVDLVETCCNVRKAFWDKIELNVHISVARIDTLHTQLVVLEERTLLRSALGSFPGQGHSRPVCILNSPYFLSRFASHLGEIIGGWRRTAAWLVLLTTCPYGGEHINSLVAQERVTCRNFVNVVTNLRLP